MSVTSSSFSFKFDLPVTTSTVPNQSADATQTPSKLLSFNNHIYSDTIVILNDGSTMHADSEVLKRVSPFFESKFSFGEASGAEKKVEVKHICESDKVFQRILLWMYTQTESDLDMRPSNVFEIFEAACLLQIPSLGFVVAKAFSNMAYNPDNMSRFYTSMKNVDMSEDQLVEMLVSSLSVSSCKKPKYSQMHCMCADCIAGRKDNQQGFSGYNNLCNTCYKCTKHCSFTHNVYMALYIPIAWLLTASGKGLTYNIFDVRKKIKGALLSHQEAVVIYLQDPLAGHGSAQIWRLGGLDMLRVKEAVQVLYGALF